MRSSMQRLRFQYKSYAAVLKGELDNDSLVEYMFLSIAQVVQNSMNGFPSSFRAESTTGLSCINAGLFRDV